MGDTPDNESASLLRSMGADGPLALNTFGLFFICWGEDAFKLRSEKELLFSERLCMVHVGCVTIVCINTIINNFFDIVLNFLNIYYHNINKYRLNFY
jgi:hypothetical protein